MNIKSIALVLTLGFVAAQAAADKVVGYFPYWSQYSQFYPKDIRYNTVTNVHYSFIVPGEDGSLSFADENDATNFKTLVDLTKENGVKLIVGVGGMENEGALKAIASSDELLPQFVSNVGSRLSANGGDGIELDWPNLTAEDAELYAKMLNALVDGLSNYTGTRVPFPSSRRSKKSLLPACRKTCSSRWCSSTASPGLAPRASALLTRATAAVTKVTSRMPN